MAKNVKGMIPMSEKQAESLNISIKEILSLDEETGLELRLKPVKRIQMPEFTMIFQATGLLVLKEIKPATLSVFWLFLCKLQYSNHIGVHQKTIAEETNLSIISVKRGIKELLDKKMIVGYADPSDARRQLYIINPHVAWKGKNKKRILAIKELVKTNPNQITIFDQIEEVTKRSALQPSSDF